MTLTLRLSMDNQLEEEIKLYHNEKNKHIIAQVSNLEAEINFLRKRIQSVEEDIQAGRAKPYHQDMLNEMNQELAEKTAEHSKLSHHLEPLHISDEFISAVKYDIQTMIGLLDADAPNPQLLHTLAGKFISNLFIQRETRKLYLTIQFKNDDVILYEKTIVANWE